jgi:hypothetical protein
MKIIVIWDYNGGLSTLSLSGHEMCPIWALTSLHPDVLASFHYLCSLIPHHVPVTYSPDLSHLHVGSLPNTPLNFFPVFFLDQQHHPFSDLSETLFLSPIGSFGGHVRAQYFHSVQW